METTGYYDPVAVKAVQDAFDTAAACRQAEHPTDMARALGRATTRLEAMAEQLEAARGEIKRLKAERDARPRVEIEQLPDVAIEPEYEGRHPENCSAAVMLQPGCVELYCRPVLERAAEQIPDEALGVLDGSTELCAEHAGDGVIRLFWRVF